jgi:hypothetical protein
LILNHDIEAALQLAASISRNLRYRSFFGSFNIEVCNHDIEDLDFDIDETLILKYFYIESYFNLGAGKVPDGLRTHIGYT